MFIPICNKVDVRVDWMKKYLCDGLFLRTSKVGIRVFLRRFVDGVAGVCAS